MHTLRTSILLGVVAAGLAGAVPPAPAAADGTTAATRAADTAVAATATLVTGDRVVLGRGGTANVRPGRGRGGMSFATGMERGHLTVVPTAMLGLVGRGRVYRRLFDVTALHATGHHDARPTSTRVDVAWTFRSRIVPDGVALPLFAIRFGPRTATGVPTWAEWLRSGPASVRTVAVEVSVDDGQGWAPTPVTHSDGGWKVRTPFGTGPVSIRVRATDSVGVTVEQALIRAYV